MDDGVVLLQRVGGARGRWWSGGWVRSVRGELAGWLAGCLGALTWSPLPRPLRIPCLVSSSRILLRAGSNSHAFLQPRNIRDSLALLKQSVQSIAGIHSFPVSLQTIHMNY
jgi:hypothetical protein